MPVAAIDIGTNSTNLLVVDDDGSTRTRIVSVTRLGAGVDRTGRLDDEAIARTLERITSYAENISNIGDSIPLRISASSACRDAANREDRKSTRLNSSHRT